ncbi:MAG: RidA family protein [Rubrivivax sp.]|nr:RidA family protein [Rubrivivax sp.]
MSKTLPASPATSSPPAKPLGNYSPVRVVPLGAVNLAFVSGLTASGHAPDDVAGQAEIIFARMRELLVEVGGDLGHVVKITTFLTDMGDYERFNAVRNRVFAGTVPPPASSTVGTTALPRAGCRVEVEAVAVIPAA